MSASNITEFKNDAQRLIHQVITMEDCLSKKCNDRHIFHQSQILFQHIVRQYSEIGHIEAMADDLDYVAKQLNKHLAHIKIIIPKENVAADHEIEALSEIYPECNHISWEDWIKLCDKAQPELEEQVVLFITTWVGRLKNVRSKQYHCRTIIVIRGFNITSLMVHDCNDTDFGGDEGVCVTFL